jgi:tRNA threonylcarbamoyl adenosine modification protein (Sua5/YciO/YrdC/YwlC family)
MTSPPPIPPEAAAGHAGPPRPPAPILAISPSIPDPDVVRQAIAVLAGGGVIAFPTDTLYGLGCQMGRDQAIARIQDMRGFDGAKRPLTFLLPDIGELAHYAKVNESAYRILNRIFPGPYCAELLATSRVPTPFVHQERRTIGVRICDTALCERLLWGLAQPMLTATAKSRSGIVLTTAQEIQREYGKDVDLILDGGPLSGSPSTVVSLVDDWVTILREGRGPSNKILVG